VSLSGTCVRAAHRMSADDASGHDSQANPPLHVLSSCGLCFTEPALVTFSWP
jgi:hypothetical protein